jgi:acyl carrier protein
MALYSPRVFNPARNQPTRYKMDDIKDNIRSHILKEILETGLDEPLANNAPLIDGGILDSISVASLMSFLEDRYKIVIEADDLSDGSMNTIDSIASMVKSKRPAA